MKLCAYNILEGGTGRIDPLAEVLRLSGAQVIVLEETWDAALFHKLADRLGTTDRFLAENPGNPEGATGLIVGGGWTLREAVNHAPLDPRLTRSAFHARVAKGDAELTIVGLHLHARETWQDEEIRLSELPAILEIGRQLKSPHLLAGDFNTSHPEQRIDIAQLRPKSRERIAKENDELPREVIRRILADGYLDTHAIHRSPAEFDTSMTTSHPATRVDFIFATPDLAGTVRSSEVFKPELARFASDHYPVVAELDL